MINLFHKKTINAGAKKMVAGSGFRPQPSTTDLSGMKLPRRSFYIPQVLKRLRTARLKNQEDINNPYVFSFHGLYCI